MSSDTDGLPRAVPSSTAAGASHSLQIVPEKLAEHTIELGEAMAQFVALIARPMRLRKPSVTGSKKSPIR